MSLFLAFHYVCSLICCFSLILALFHHSIWRLIFLSRFLSFSSNLFPFSFVSLSPHTSVSFTFIMCYNVSFSAPHILHFPSPYKIYFLYLHFISLILIVFTSFLLLFCLTLLFLFVFSLLWILTLKKIIHFFTLQYVLKITKYFFFWHLTFSIWTCRHLKKPDGLIKCFSYVSLILTTNSF